MSFCKQINMIRNIYGGYKRLQSCSYMTECFRLLASNSCTGQQSDSVIVQQYSEMGGKRLNIKDQTSFSQAWRWFHGGGGGSIKKLFKWAVNRFVHVLQLCRIVCLWSSQSTVMFSGQQSVQCFSCLNLHDNHIRMLSKEKFLTEVVEGAQSEMEKFKHIDSLSKHFQGPNCGDPHNKQCLGIHIRLQVFLLFVRK